MADDGEGWGWIWDGLKTGGAAVLDVVTPNWMFDPSRFREQPGYDTSLWLGRIGVGAGLGAGTLAAARAALLTLPFAYQQMQPRGLFESSGPGLSRIFVRPGLSAAEEAATRIHEGMHWLTWRLLPDKLYGWTQSLYDRGGLYTVMDEWLAETAGSLRPLASAQWAYQEYATGPFWMDTVIAGASSLGAGYGVWHHYRNESADSHAPAGTGAPLDRSGPGATGLTPGLSGYWPGDASQSGTPLPAIDAARTGVFGSGVELTPFRGPFDSTF